MAHLKDNIGANNVKFTASELQEFNNELNAIQIIGERLPAGVQAMSGVEAALKK